MALPTYNKDKRKKSFEVLPKGAYVVQIKSARQDNNKSGSGTHLTIAFDIAEGEYKGFYQNAFDRNTNEDKKWPNDAIFYLNVPEDSSPQYTWDNWNTFFADLEDSNNSFVFSGDVSSLKGKVIGGKFHIEQTEYKGNIYDHTKMRWTCVADDVRNGKPGKMPKDKLISSNTSNTPDFVTVPEGTDEEIPF